MAASSTRCRSAERSRGGDVKPVKPRRRVSARALFWQGLLIAAVVAIFAYFARNAEVNLAKRSLTFGFAFLAHPAGVRLPVPPPALQPPDPLRRALWVCIVNTLLVSGLAIVTASLLGLLLGVMRL